jgi:hypothetical protein
VRRVIFVAAALLLSGCGTDEFFSRPIHYLTGGWRPRVTFAAPKIQTTDAIDAHCREVADQRAMDARANRYSIEMEHIIYEGTYKDCVAWDSQHAH